MKKTKAVLLLVVAALLIGCVSRNDGFPQPKPVAEVIWLRKYSVEEFERMMQQELKDHTARENSSPENISPEDEDGVTNLYFFLHPYPTPKEWAKWKKKIRTGDEIWKFKHVEYGRYWHGSNESYRRGYCLVRGLRVISTIDVNFDLNDEEEKTSQHVVAPAVKLGRQ